MSSKEIAIPICPYCKQQSSLVTGETVYPNPSLFYLHRQYFYYCQPCDAYVGCHGMSKVPLGSMANRTLRDLRKKAHAAFDPLWRSKVRMGAPKKKARLEAYTWLANRMGMDLKTCHIGMMNDEQCQRVVLVVKELIGEAA